MKPRYDQGDVGAEQQMLTYPTAANSSISDLLQHPHCGHVPDDTIQVDSLMSADVVSPCCQLKTEALNFSTLDAIELEEPPEIPPWDKLVHSFELDNAGAPTDCDVRFSEHGSQDVGRLETQDHATFQPLLSDCGSVQFPETSFTFYSQLQLEQTHADCAREALQREDVPEASRSAVSDTTERKAELDREAAKLNNSRGGAPLEHLNKEPDVRLSSFKLRAGSITRAEARRRSQFNDLSVSHTNAHGESLPTTPPTPRHQKLCETDRPEVSRTKIRLRLLCDIAPVSRPDDQLGSQKLKDSPERHSLSTQRGSKKLPPLRTISTSEGDINPEVGKNVKDQRIGEVGMSDQEDPRASAPSYHISTQDLISAPQVNKSTVLLGEKGKQVVPLVLDRLAVIVAVHSSRCKSTNLGDEAINHLSPFTPRPVTKKTFKNSQSTEGVKRPRRNETLEHALRLMEAQEHLISNALFKNSPDFADFNSGSPLFSNQAPELHQKLVGPPPGVLQRSVDLCSVEDNRNTRH